MTDITRKSKKILSKLHPIDLFLIISIIITGSFFIVNWMNDGELFAKCILSAQDEFSDYFMHVAASSDRENLYSLSDSFCFPPLAYCMYYLLWKVNPLNGNDILEWKDYKLSDNAVHVFLAYNILLVILLIWCICIYYKKLQTKYILLLPIVIIFSYPFYCTSLQRGNSVALIAVLISLAWVWMDSDSKFEKELAMLLIAVAAGFKFYPAIMGIAYVIKKDWKRTFRLVIYGIIAVFVPFCFFGGLRGLSNLLNTLLGLGISDVMYRYGTVRGIAETYVSLWTNMGVEQAYNIGGIVETLFLLISVLCFCLSKKKWQRVLFISGILASYVSSSWMYTCAYYLPALLIFLKENDKDMSKNAKKENVWLVINIIAFAFIFSIPFFFIYIFHGGIYEGVFVVAYILLIINMINILIGFGKDCLQKRKIPNLDKV